MSEIAVIMAAGLGSRMKPFTDAVPKPLIRVHGTPMIETVIEGLLYRGVSHIYVVAGYKSDQFWYLTEKYDCISLVKNHEYAHANNISSIHAVCSVLENTRSDCFICEADLFVADKTVFDTQLAKSCYFGKEVQGYSDDWVFSQDMEGRITHIGKGGEGLMNRAGVAFFLKDDARLLATAIKEEYRHQGYETMFWDDVVEKNIDKFELMVHRIVSGQIIEIDTADELAAADSEYAGEQGDILRL